MKRFGSGNSLSKVHIFTTKNFYKQDLCAAVSFQVFCDLKKNIVVICVEVPVTLVCIQPLLSVSLHSEKPAIVFC